MFLYLTTTGRRTGFPREIEIWFTERDGRFYLIAEHRERANWVRNIRADSRVQVRVGDRRFAGTARVVEDEQEPDLARAVKALSDAKYSWSYGLIVESRRNSEIIGRQLVRGRRTPRQGPEARCVEAARKSPGASGRQPSAAALRLSLTP